MIMQCTEDGRHQHVSSEINNAYILAVRDKTTHKAAINVLSLSGATGLFVDFSSIDR